MIEGNQTSKPLYFIASNLHLRFLLLLAESEIHCKLFNCQFDCVRLADLIYFASINHSPLHPMRVGIHLLSSDYEESNVEYHLFAQSMIHQRRIVVVSEYSSLLLLRLLLIPSLQPRNRLPLESPLVGIPPAKRKRSFFPLFVILLLVVVVVVPRPIYSPFNPSPPPHPSVELRAFRRALATLI
jgi:hypothetical protein